MRLWHPDLFPYLPRQQLVAQKRECDLIWKDIQNGKKTNHILINFIWNYSDCVSQFAVYYSLLRDEFFNRGYGFKPAKGCPCLACGFVPFSDKFNDDYLRICCWNLYEKMLCGQTGFTPEAQKFIREVISK